jgi:hypothetical protein
MPIRLPYPRFLTWRGAYQDTATLPTQVRSKPRAHPPTPAPSYRSYGVSRRMPSSGLGGRGSEGVRLQGSLQVTALRAVEAQGVRIAGAQGGVRRGRCVRGRHQLPHRGRDCGCVGRHRSPRPILPQGPVPGVRWRGFRAGHGLHVERQCSQEGSGADCVQQLQRAGQDQPGGQAGASGVQGQGQGQAQVERERERER